VGPNPLIVPSLGRMCIAGNSSTHPIKLVYASSGNDVPNGSLLLNMSGRASGQFLYSALPTPVSLQPRTSYYLVTQEFSGSDRWFDHGAISTTRDITELSDASVNSSIYSYNGVTWIPADAQTPRMCHPLFSTQ